MTLEQYQTLMGVTVPTAQQAKVTATIARTQSMLETLLGFTLNPAEVTTNLYTELGKTIRECACPSVDSENLNDPDAVVGAYRLYRIHENDKFIHIDPATTVHAVKLVYIKQGTGDNGITIKTYDWNDIRVQYKGDITRFIEDCDTSICACSCSDCVQLAVDADWVWQDSADIPDDLNYLWGEMIEYYSNSKRNIKSESIDSHTYTRFDDKPPQATEENLAILRKYAGPYGSAVVMPI